MVGKIRMRADYLSKVFRMFKPKRTLKLEADGTIVGSFVNAEERNYYEHFNNLNKMREGMEFKESTTKLVPMTSKELFIIEGMFGTFNLSNNGGYENFILPRKKVDLKKAGKIATRLLNIKIEKAVFVPVVTEKGTRYTIYSDQ